MKRKPTKTKTKKKKKAPLIIQEIEILPEAGTTVPAIPEPKSVTTYMMCEAHVDTQFRVGGFCEKCYGEETKDRIMQLDVKLDELVLARLDTLVNLIVTSDDVNMIERFLGRIMKRFSRPDTKRVEARLQAVHLHGPVDFGRPQ